MPESEDRANVRGSGSEPAVLQLTGRVLLVTLAAISSVFAWTLGLAYLITILLGFAFDLRGPLGLPVYVRFAGALLSLVGIAFLLWTYILRNPRDILLSTYVTIRKFIGRRPLELRMGRTEPFVPRGPYRFVRNPIYFGAVSILTGLGFALTSELILFWGVLLGAWFWFFLIPFEERELAVLFGSEYQEYRRRVPKMFPYGRRYRPTASESP